MPGPAPGSGRDDIVVTGSLSLLNQSANSMHGLCGDYRIVFVAHILMTMLMVWLRGSVWQEASCSAVAAALDFDAACVLCSGNLRVWQGWTCSAHPCQGPERPSES